MIPRDFPFATTQNLDELGCADDVSDRRWFAQRMRERAVEELTRETEPAELEELRRGWCLGGAGFRERMLRVLDGAGEKLRRPHLSPRDARVERDHGVDEAGRLLAENYAASVCQRKICRC